jgi:hypothetical protein
MHNPTLNSETRPLANGQLVVIAYDSMAAFVNYDPDEEAFIIGHEIGHVQDWMNCQTFNAQMAQHELLSKKIALSKACPFGKRAYPDIPASLLMPVGLATCAINLAIQARRFAKLRHNTNGISARTCAP